MNLEKVSIFGSILNYCCNAYSRCKVIACKNESELRQYILSISSVCSLLKELKECAGRVFVDSEPEFCLPEVCVKSVRDITSK